MKPKKCSEVESLNPLVVDIEASTAAELERATGGSNPDADCVIFTGPCFDYCGPCSIYGIEPL